MILKCKCKHESQDTLHGSGNRVMTPLVKKQGLAQQYRCTVCATVRLGPEKGETS